MSGGGGYGAYGGDCGGGGYGTYDERRGTTTADADNADNRLRSSFLELLRTDDQVPSIIRAITQIDNAAPRDTPHSPHSEVEAVAERGGHDGDDGDDDATTEATAVRVSGGRKRSAEAIRRRAREKYLKKQNTTNTN
ncbi:hypothetical protein RI054_16g77890 [Pseudoscourfieldia marina]